MIAALDTPARSLRTFEAEVPTPTLSIGRARKLGLRQRSRGGTARGFAGNCGLSCSAAGRYAFLSNRKRLHLLAQGLGFGGQLAHGQVDAFHYLQILSRHICN
jgi:hypothetical protein